MRGPLGVQQAISKKVQMRYLLILPFLLACATGRSAGEPLRSTDCSGVSALTQADDQADSLWNAALLRVYNCPQEAAKVLGSLWLDPPEDSVRQKRVHAVSSKISDRQLFEAVARVLSNIDRPQWHRLDALAVFVNWADSTAVLAMNQAPWRAPNGEIVSVTPTIGFIAPAHTYRIAGAAPMGVEERRQMLDLVRQVAEQDRDISVRGVAQYIDAWLGGLPPRSGWR